jgi:hypothetical protein
MRRAIGAFAFDHLGTEEITSGAFTAFREFIGLAP